MITRTAMTVIAKRPDDEKEQYFPTLTEATVKKFLGQDCETRIRPVTFQMEDDFFFDHATVKRVVE